MTPIDEIGWEDVVLLSNPKVWSILMFLYDYSLNFHYPITFKQLYLKFHEMPYFEEELEKLIESNYVRKLYQSFPEQRVSITLIGIYKIHAAKEEKNESL